MMKIIFYNLSMLSLVAFINPTSVLAQNGKLISEKMVVIPDYVIQKIKKSPGASEFSEIQSTTNVSVITYMSDSLKISGYIARPKKEGVYPVIIYNRGGNREFSALNFVSATYLLGRMANWGYVVVASNYRGGPGSEGMEEFGGRDVNDIRNLIPLLAHDKMADTSRMGVYGVSRGGMMTYLLLRNNCSFKAAVINSGLSDLVLSVNNRPKMEKSVEAELIPNYAENKKAELEKRSAVLWADELCKKTPLLIMQGSSDWRVSLTQALDMVSQLYKLKHPVRFLFLEGAEHGLGEYQDLVWDNVHKFFDHYVKEEQPLPNMKPHGN